MTATILGVTPALDLSKPLIVTQSDISAYKSCRRKWMLTSYLGLRPKEDSVYGPLTLGTRLHNALELYYTHGWNPVEQYMILVEGEKEDHARSGIMYDERAYDNEAELGRIMLEGYMEWLEETGADADYEITGAENKVSYNLEVDGVEVELRGKIDIRARNKVTGALLVMDHKSAVNPSRLIPGLPKNEQLKMYMMLERLQHPKDSDAWVNGAVFNILRKVRRGSTAKPPFYFRVEQLHNSTTMREFWLQTYGTLQDYVQTVKRLQDGVNPTSAAYPTAGDQCAWCPVKTVCDLMNDGSRADDMVEALYRTGNPHERYETQPAALIDNSSN